MGWGRPAEASTDGRLLETQGYPAALHGRRRGKKLSAHRDSLVRTLLPRLSIDVSAPIAEISSLFPVRPDTLWLEVGFGGGEHLVAEAIAHPSAGYIGCEYFLNGIAKTLALIEAREPRNLRLYNGDARTVIAALPPASLNGAFVLYPDPWPKRRHHERRFLSDDLLARLARIMRSGAELRFATDIDGNAGWTIARVLRSPDFAWTVSDARDWQVPWKGWQGTRYEAKALLEGRRPAYFTFVRK